MKANTAKPAKPAKPKNPRYNVYCRTKDNGKQYYWASIPGTDQDGDRIYATIFVRMSKAAASKFDDLAETTNNEAVVRCYLECSVDQAWLKAIPGGDDDYNNVALFVNDFTPITE